MDHSIVDMFIEYQSIIDEELDMREAIGNICKYNDRLSRQLASMMQVIHKSDESVAPACLKAREMFAKAHEGYQQLKEAVPKEDYYRFYDHWRNMTQRYCFLITLTIWLEAGFLARHETVAEILGISISHKDNEFHLELEDYFFGTLMLCTELARLAVNTVTRGDFSRALQIYGFVMELDAGFNLINLRSDNMRKRLDAHNHDVKKVEEVVYDLSIRKLLGTTGPDGDSDIDE